MGKSAGVRNGWGSCWQVWATAASLSMPVNGLSTRGVQGLSTLEAEPSRRDERVFPPFPGFSAPRPRWNVVQGRLTFRAEREYPEGRSEWRSVVSEGMEADE